MICGDRDCACGLTSTSLTITGSGADGDPWVIDSDAFIICTSTTRPSPPEPWQHIFETDTGRQRYWNGTHWVWVAGNPPSVALERTSALSVTVSGTAQDLPFLTEVYDTDAYHVGTDHFVTIPAGLGGDYWVAATDQWAANAVGYRAMILTVGSNADVSPAQFSTRRAGGTQMENTLSNGFPQSFPYRLEAGATVTAQVLQTSGGALDVNFAALSLTMFRHIPSLT